MLFKKKEPICKQIKLFTPCIKKDCIHYGEWRIIRYTRSKTIIYLSHINEHNRITFTNTCQICTHFVMPNNYIPKDEEEVL